MGRNNNTLLLFVMYGSAFLAGFNENLMNMGLMDIMTDFSVDSITAQWLVTGYMIVATVVVTAMAFLYRRFKLRPLFFVGALFSIVGSGMGLFSTNFAMLMAARLVQAAGLGLFIPMMMNTILCVVPKNRLGSYMAIGGCMISFGPAFAPVVCGALVTALGWHSIFIVPFFGMIVLTVMGFVFVRNMENSDAHLDVVSVVLSAVFLFTLSFGLAQVTSSLLVGGASLVAAVASGAIFVLRQRSTAHPLIDMSPMSRVTFWPAVLLVVIAMLITFSLSVLLPLYFEGALGMSALFAGLVILVPVVINSGLTLVAGRVMDKRGEWPLLPVGFALMAVGAIAMAVVAPSLNVVAMFVAAVFAYAGVGLVFSPSQTAGLRTLPPQENPFGVALMTTFTQIAACIGPSMFVGIMSSNQAGLLSQGAGEEIACAQGFSVAIMVAAAFTVAGLVCAFLFSRAAVKRDAAAAAAPRPQAVPGSLTNLGLADVINPNPFTIPSDIPVFAAMRQLVETKHSGAPLVDAKGKLAGYVSDGDIMRYLAKQHPAFSTAYSFLTAANTQSIDERLKELMDLPISTIATETAVTLSADASLEDACDLLANHKLEKVPVIDRAGKIVGSLNRAEIMTQMMKTYLDQKNLAIAGA